MMKFFKFALVAAAALILAGCEDEKPKKFVTFHIANPMWIESANSRSQMTMPLSGLNLVVNNIEFMYSGDLDRIDLAQVRTADGGVIDGFLFVCNDRGKKRLYTQTASNLNAYVVAMYDKKPIAARKIDGVVSDGKIFAISELPTDTDLVKFKDDMNESIKTAEELKNEN